MRDSTSIRAHRAAYAKTIVAAKGPSTEALIAAFASVEREHFVGPPPWTLVGGEGGPTRTDDPRELYQDVLVVLAADRGINNGQPLLHAQCLAACAPSAGDTVVHVGAGTGYYTAILATLVQPAGRVVAYEIEADLAQRARANLSGFDGVEVVGASATDTALPAADVIYVNAGATHPPAAWLDALRTGGRLVFPLTPDRGAGCMLLVTKLGAQRHAARAWTRVGFIACIGARDAASSPALAHALATQPLSAVRSLHRGTSPPRDAWYAGTDWWLSTASPG